MESLVTAVIPVVIYKLTGGTSHAKNFAIFMLSMFVVTILIMFYRCKIASPPDNNGNKPSVEISKTYIALIPIFIWALSVFLFPYLIKFRAPIPVISIMIIVTSMLGLFIVSLFLYNSALRFGVVPQCYPSVIDQFFGFLRKLWPF